MLFLPHRGVSRDSAGWRALGLSLGLCVLCASCGGRTDAGDDGDEDRGAPEPTGAGAGVRPGGGSDSTRPDTVSGGAPRPSSSLRDFAPLPGEDADAWVQRLLVDNCAECHSEASSVNALIMSRWLLPTDPASSPAIQVLMSRTPPHDDLGWPSQAEIFQLCLTDASLRDQCRTLVDELGPLLR